MSQSTERFRENHQKIDDILFQKIHANFGYDLECDFGERDGHNLDHVYVHDALGPGRTLNRDDVITKPAELDGLKAYFERFQKVLSDSPPPWLTSGKVLELQGLLAQGHALVQLQIDEVARQPSSTKSLVIDEKKQPQHRPSFWTPQKIALVSVLTPTTAFLVLVGIEASLTMAKKSATSLLEGMGDVNILIATLAFFGSLATTTGIYVTNKESNSDYRLVM